METSPPSINEIARLKLAVESKEIGLKTISNATGVHISQVSRILSGQSKRLSGNVEKICKFARQLSLPPQSIESEEILMAAVKDLWDGTEKHAIALASLLKAINQYHTTTQHSPSSSED